MKIRKLKRKKSGSVTSVPSEPGWNRFPSRSQNPCAVSTQVRPWPKNTSTSQIRVTTTTTNRTSFQIVRQKETRRRATMSASRRASLSTPKRLGVSMKRRKSRSTSPRKAATSITVRSRA